MLGRPACIPTYYVDCKLPAPEEVTTGEGGRPSPDCKPILPIWRLARLEDDLVWDVKYQLARDVYTLLLEHVLGTKRVKYSEIVELGQKLRDATPATFHSLLSSHLPHQSSLMLSYLCSQYQFHSEYLLKLQFSTTDIYNPQPSFSCTSLPSLQHC